MRPPERKESSKIPQCKPCQRKRILTDKRVLTPEPSLKLKVYRSLGIDADHDTTGAYNKATIRNTQKGDVHVVNIDPKFSRYFYANYFWQTL